MNDLNALDIDNWFKSNYQNKLSGRRIIYDQISFLLNDLTSDFKLMKLGNSFQKLPINSVEIGNGKIKILLWSQMHGNESTATKAIFDLFNYFENPLHLIEIQQEILKNCTLLFIPMLNPDGALAYTRENAQNIDLNRDAVVLNAPESKILNTVLKEFNPHYCFNLHDQRTIYSVGKDNDTATISFLAPSEDETRVLTEGRKETMRVIVAMQNLLEKFIPHNIGRYTDEFYPTATGDNFQKAGYNTVLIESGHFKNDYDREKSRKFTFFAILQGLYSIANGLNSILYKSYFEIPNNQKYYLDIIIKNVSYQSKKTDIGILYKETLNNNVLTFEPHIEKIQDLSNYNANTIIDENNLIFMNKNEIINYIKKNT